MVLVSANNVAYRGSDTGRVYNVGQAYSMAGDVYRLQGDGTFRNERTGRSTVGSSQNPSLGISGGSLGASGSGTSRGSSGTGGRAGSGPGVAAVAVPGRPVGAGPGAGGAVTNVVNQPLKRVGAGGPQEAAGAISSVGYYAFQSPIGIGYQIVQSEDAKARTEDDLYAQTEWMVRNRILPDLGLTPQPYPNFLPQPGTPGAYKYDGFGGFIPNPGGGSYWKPDAGKESRQVPARPGW